MGRKNRKKIITETHYDKDIQKQELGIEDQYENIEEIIQEQKILNDDLVWDIRNNMLKYCDDNSLPLCDYLTLEIFNQFIEYLTE